MSPWLALIGLGEEGLEGLSPAARRLVESAEVLVGGARHLALLPPDGRERLTWPTPLAALIPEILRRRGRAVCVLASGDPLCYGVGATLLRHLEVAETVILPAPSAFSLACARLGWSLPDVETLTLHGRPLALLRPFLQPGARVLALSAGPTTPAEAAALLTQAGYGKARLVALESMGGPAERRYEATAESWSWPEVGALNTLAVACPELPDAPLLPRLPGLPDAAFRNDGQLTKREVRAATLAALQPVPGQLLWDVGAGCGSVAIEWMRCHPRCRALAVERDPERQRLIAENAAALGVPRLGLVAGAAPQALAGLEAPDAVFLGGGLESEGLFEAAWKALLPGGRLVANAVTLEGEARLLALARSHGGELLRLSLARAEPLGSFHVWRPAMTVTQWRLAKAATAQEAEA